MDLYKAIPDIGGGHFFAPSKARKANKKPIHRMGLEPIV